MPGLAQARLRVVAFVWMCWLILIQPAAGMERAEPPWQTHAVTAAAQPERETSQRPLENKKVNAAPVSATQSQLAPRRPREDSSRTVQALPPPAEGGSQGGLAATSLTSVVGGLGIVIGLFLITAWLMRKSMPAGMAALPAEAFEVLGRSRLHGKQQVSLVRCGGKLLLVSQSADGPRTLTEIEQPEEVARLAGLCKPGPTRNSSSAFRDVFAQLGGVRREPAGRGNHGT